MMTNAPGWTQENLLDEALDLIDKIDKETDAAKIKQLEDFLKVVSKKRERLENE
jgi:hypothetical protein